jgi:c(7)-type cytochrome triheme protein
MSPIMYRTVMLALACAALGLAGAAGAQGRGAVGKGVYEKSCTLCHAGGLAGAPKLGDAKDWAARLKTGAASLYRNALEGTPRGMPGKGGNLNLSDAEVRAAVDYMVASVGGLRRGGASDGKAPTAAKDAAADTTAELKPSALRAPAQLQPTDTSDVNAFNRLFVPSKPNPPPSEDGIHDPASPGTLSLQAPLAAFGVLPRSNAGNRVDWVAALVGAKIRPRWERADQKAGPPVMDLNIVREVKGSMPDVVYSHKQHTEWLDCSNCHPAIFVPQKGANQMSMASILLGKQCGVCHGKVAFPVSECRLCHSKKKTPAGTSAAAGSAEGGKP